MKRNFLALILAALFMCNALFVVAYAEGTPSDIAPTPVVPVSTPEPIPSSDPLPSADPTASPNPLPSPPPSSTPPPSIEPSPSVSPSPTPTPNLSVTFSGESSTTVALMDMEFNLLNGISATDEAGHSVPVSVKDNGGFNVRQVGVYTVIYSAKHPVTKTAYTYKRIITVQKSAEQMRYNIEFSGGSLCFKVGDSAYNLLNDAAAVDETGKRVKIYVSNTGGFNIDVIGTYTVTYSAQHPVLGEIFSASRTVQVMSEQEYTKYLQSTNPLYGKSNSRYYKYLKYRDEIYEVMRGKMNALTASISSQIELVAKALGYSSYHIVRPLPELLDDSGLEGNSAVITPSMAQSFSPNLTPYEQLDTLSFANWSDILAVFVATSTLNVNDPLDLYNLRKISFDGMDKVFDDMVDVTYHVENGELWMVISGFSAYEMMDRYGMEQGKRDALEELLQPEFQSVFASLTGNESFVELNEAEISKIRAGLPRGLDVGRESVIVTAHSLVGKVDYFWGGKYPQIGWNSSWGIPRLVTSLGSKTTGKVRPYGMDCSGFVTWVFINASKNPSIIDSIGNGSANQWSKSISLGWDEAEPGDLTFRRTPSSAEINHVGIVVSKAKDGTYMVAHCSSSLNGVVVTEAWSSGFRYMRRPLLYSDATASIAQRSTAQTTYKDGEAH